jgi:kynurenine formamidase
MTYKYLSHILDNNTPTYGNEYNISIQKSHSIGNGNIANESTISTTIHIGTHIDLPYHFYENGQTIESYDASFWIFKCPLLVEVDVRSGIINDELREALQPYRDNQLIDLIMVKTGTEEERSSEKFWLENPGFDPSLYEYLTKTFPNLRVFGFDSISLSSYKHPKIGIEAHRHFLNPKKPVLVIEDMHLSDISIDDNILEVIIAPMRIAKCDGMPCTIVAKVKKN